MVTLGIAAPSRLSNARLEVTDIAWQRFDNRLASDYATYLKNRLAIDIVDPTFMPGKSGSASRVLFTAQNAGAYGYWKVRFVIRLLRGDVVVAVNTVEADALDSGQSRPLVASWFEQITAGTKVDIRPEVNILDQSVFMP